ncbi:MAG: hypothetical protein OXJ90_21600 [Spirochaetaceae bacterium]|nr:hypothetical protein [Spirochaetaceae bacterium]
MRFFNAAGPVSPGMHYHVPPLSRIDVDDLMLVQTRAYMDRCAATEGQLVIFDRREDRSWAEKLYRRDEAEGGSRVTVWGM